MPQNKDFISEGEEKEENEEKEEEKIITTAISGIKGDIINSYATTRSIRTPCAFKYDIEICVLIDVSLSIVPCGTLIIV